MSPNTTTARAARGRSVRRMLAVDVHINKGVFGERVERRVFGTKEAMESEWGDTDTSFPVAILDLRAEAVEGYVLTLATSEHEHENGKGYPNPWEIQKARAALSKLLGPLPKRHNNTISK